MRLELLASAERDLEHLYEYGTDRFGFDAATSYASGLVHSLGLIADQSRMGRERTEIAPGIRSHPYRSHVMLYRIDARAVVIVRILDARQDWREQLG